MVRIFQIKLNLGEIRQTRTFVVFTSPSAPLFAIASQPIFHKNTEEKIKLMDFINFLKTNIDEFQELDKKSNWKIEKQWKEAFLSENKLKTGKYNEPGQTLWDVLSEYSFSGMKSECEYEKISAECFYIGTGYYGTIKIYKCNGKLPNLLTIRNSLMNMDIYLFDCDMKWTMVVTHEQNYSSDPYFKYSSA